MPELFCADGAARPERSAAPGEDARNALVIELYAATLARSLNERKAFDAAVHLYRRNQPDSPDDEARRAVANLICHKV
jgi:hypothetical protein